MKKLLLFCGFLLSLHSLKAQENTVTSGGDASGSTGSVSYSIGQLDYNTANGSNGTLTEGVQQPFEIIVVTGITETAIDLKFSVYPNPSTEYVILTTENPISRSLYFTLFNEQGKQLANQQIQNASTIIPFGELAVGIYFIQITDNNNKAVKSFKVLKNK